MNEELKQALDDLVNKYYIGNFVYDVRSRISNDDDDWFDKNPNTSSWEHPDVLRFSKCISIIEKAIK